MTRMKKVFFPPYIFQGFADDPHRTGCNKVFHCIICNCNKNMLLVNYFRILKATRGGPPADLHHAQETLFYCLIDLTNSITTPWQYIVLPLKWRTWGDPIIHCHELVIELVQSIKQWKSVSWAWSRSASGSPPWWP